MIADPRFLKIAAINIDMQRFVEKECRRCGVTGNGHRVLLIV